MNRRFFYLHADLLFAGVLICLLVQATSLIVLGIQDYHINKATEALLYVEKCRSPYTGASSCSTQSKNGLRQYLQSL